MSGHLIERWASRSGKHWVELRRTEYGYGYRSVGAMGFFGDVSEEEARRLLAARLPDFQPDAAKTPMRRVV